MVIWGGLVMISQSHTLIVIFLPRHQILDEMSSTQILSLVETES
jgi:hypothetical protein